VREEDGKKEEDIEMESERMKGNGGKVVKSKSMLECFEN